MFIKRYSIFVFLGIILLGFLLRFHNFHTWPRVGATFDEYAWTWQGMNLLQTGIPKSWSPHPQYENANSIIYQKTHFRIVQPFLEHPPVFGLVAGSFAILNGVSDMYDVSIVKIRPLALILGVISIFLIFLLTKELYSIRIGLLSALLYATIPTIVIGSRIVQNENFFIPVWLCVLYLTAKYIKGKRKIFRNLVIILCSLLVLAKIPWIAAGISIFGIFIFYKKYKDALLILFGVIFALFLFTAYGYYYDWDLFVNLWKLQANRYDIAFNSIYALFQKPFLVDRYYTDGWIYFGWFAFILLLAKDLRKYIFIVTPLLAYFLIYLAGIPDEAGHGWYRYPFYPFLIISIALFIKEYFVKNFALSFIFLVFIGTSLFQLTWEVMFGFSYAIFRLMIISWGLVLIPLYFNNSKTVKMARLVGYSWLLIYFLINIWAIMTYNEQ